MDTDTQSCLLDLIGVGIGPFNLGLATMLTKAEDVKAMFFEQKPQFDWHPGLLLEGTTLQVPFFADLVTMADPTSPFSFLNYLKEHNRLFHFYFLEKFHIPRVEYNHYCQWVSQQLESCYFGQQVTSVTWHKGDNHDYFSIEVMEIDSGSTKKYWAKNLVLGVGSTPNIHPKFQGFHSEEVFHSSTFKQHRNRCRKADSITVVGSGQSAAEVFYALLQEQTDYDYKLDWLTRSDGFFPMEYSKLGLEHFSPDYTTYFHHLPQNKRDDRILKQDLLYKGISTKTIADIYDLIYERTACGSQIPVRLLSQIEVQQIKKQEHGEKRNYQLSCFQKEQEKHFAHESEMVIFATGYQRKTPSCLSHLESLICRDEKNRTIVNRNYQLVLTEETNCSIFVQNDELHTHGIGSPDLGLGAYRNSVIINKLSHRNIYPVSDRNIYQQFGISFPSLDNSNKDVQKGVSVHE
jgi:lysine N6-hydroxylase